MQANLVRASLTLSLALHSRFMHTTSTVREAKTGTGERLSSPTLYPLPLLPLGQNRAAEKFDL